MDYHSLSDLTIAKELGHRLKQLRLNQNYSQQELAKMQGKQRQRASKQQTKEDFISVVKNFKISKPLVIINEVEEAITNWPSFAESAGLSAEITARISKQLVHLSFL